MDLYLDKKVVAIPKESLQLIAVASLFIACKYDVSFWYSKLFFIRFNTYLPAHSGGTREISNGIRMKKQERSNGAPIPLSSQPP